MKGPQVTNKPASMTILGDIDVNTKAGHRRTSGQKSNLVLHSSDEDNDSDEDYDVAVGIKPSQLRSKKKSILYMDSDDDDAYF